jgi:hypothetical protein
MQHDFLAAAAGKKRTVSKRIGEHKKKKNQILSSFLTLLRAALSSKPKQ